ncbi:MAG: glutamyl-tRNA reductase, partial [Ottowia sp.]|nr:glutamyl-tRNA reductase [Ottowia sp.]
MQVYVLGLNHQTAPVAVREALAFGPDRLPAALTSLVREPGVGEAAILSTCNRTEIWFAGDAPQVVSDWLARFQNVALEAFSPSLYLHAGEAAVHHVFRVACGLDSMVLGETQILGQVKSAMREAQTVGTLGAILHRLFQSAFSAAKAVRSDTAVGANIVSMAAAAVHLCERIFEDIRGQRVLFIGAGEMISLCAAHFAAAAPQEIVVVNRTAARAQPLAERFGARALPLDSLSDILPQFDIVLSCTASPVPIIGLGLAERAIRERRHKPVVMIDLAVPRDIEPEIGRL